MLNRTAPLVVCLTLLLGAAFAQNPQGIGNAIEFAGSGSGQFQVYPENAATFATSNVTNTGPANPVQVVAKADGSKYYIVGAAAVDSIDPAFTTPKTINGLTGTFSQAVMSPDGRFLMVASTQGTGNSSVYILNSTTDTVLLSQPVIDNVIGMVVSRDSSTLWILGESNETFITTVSLNTTPPAQVGAPIYLENPMTGNTLGQGATSLTLSPLGLLYVTADNQLLEIDPSGFPACQASPLTCSPATVIQGFNATPGPPQFTPDGSLMYFVNRNPSIGGQALIRVALPSHTILVYHPPPIPAEPGVVETFDSILVAGQNRIFAHSPGDTTLWDVAGDLSSVTVSTLSNVMPVTSISSAVISDELPSAQYLFLMAGGASLTDVYMVNLSSNSVTAQVTAALGQGPLQFVYVPSESPSAFTNPPLTYPGNVTQTVAANTVAAPLIARVLDQNGNPVFTVPVTFSGDASLNFNPVNTTTNADGYVMTSVTVGSTPGAYPVTMTVGTGSNSVTATFTLTIPGGTPTGPTGPGAVNQLSIVQGNGQLYQAGQLRLGDPNSVLTVQLLDTNGKPLATQGVPVTFQVTGPAIGAVDNPSALTDINGMATTNFFAGSPGENTPFQSTAITATAVGGAGNVLGTVNFVETVYQNNPDGTGQPTIFIENPRSLEIQGGEGDAIPNAIQAVIYSGSYGGGRPIPNIGIRIADPLSPILSGPGTCQGAPLSDQTGTINCNFIPVCATALNNNVPPIPYGLGLHGFSIDVGESGLAQNYGVTITQGSTQMLSIGAGGGGSGQSGNPNSALPFPLTANITDQCGTAVSGVSVTWKITQGSAVFSNSTNTITSVTNAGGNATAKLTLGSSPGPVTITATIAGSAPLTYTATVNALVGSLTLVQGGQQSALEGVGFTQSLIFALLDNKNNPLVGFTVNFSLASGSASLSVPSAVTNALGQVTVSAIAGVSPGPVTIKATFGTFSASAALTVLPPGPNVQASSFVNAASLQSGLVPCGLATVTGTGLASGVSGVVSGNTLGIGPLPYTLEGVSISVDGAPAPILSVSNQQGVQQVNFQTPCEIPTGSGTVVVEVNSATTTVNVIVYPTQPGIFTYAGPGGLAYGWVISAADGSYITPSNLAHAGQTYYLVATGFGQTTPIARTNAPGSGAQTIPIADVVLAIDNIGVPVTSVQYLEGAVGEYVITFTIPTVTNGAAFPTGTNLPIKLGGITTGGQTIYDTAVVDLPGID